MKGDARSFDYSSFGYTTSAICAQVTPVVVSMSTSAYFKMDAGGC